MASAAAGWLTAIRAAAASRRRRTPASSPRASTASASSWAASAGLAVRGRPLRQIGGRLALAGGEQVPGRVGVVAHVREAGVDRPPCVVVDEVDDGVGEQGA